LVTDLVAGDFSGHRCLAGILAELSSATETAVFPRGGLGFSCAASGKWFSADFFSLSGSGCCPLVSFSLVFSGLSSSLR